MVSDSLGNCQRRVALDVCLSGDRVSVPSGNPGNGVLALSGDGDSGLSGGGGAGISGDGDFGHGCRLRRCFSYMRAQLGIAQEAEQ